MGKDLTNQFFDINKLPAQEGLLIFPISMSRISNSQNAKRCFDHMKRFSPNKIIKPVVGLNMVYGDYLYLYSNEKASKLRKKFMPLILQHKNEFMKIISKNPMLIPQAFSFSTWNQILLASKDFVNLFGQIRKRYKGDSKFRKYLKEDFLASGKGKLDQNQIDFFLEETLIFHLITKGQIPLHNDYVKGHEKWVLWCYPGKPLKSQIYLSQKNFFNFKNKKNKFENCFYDLEEKKLYDFERLNLEKVKV
ncbi:hypothetical protein KO465_09490 [Candidatus Micrarchaeota archaeon]|nr:hypothetical protein [Candidatus Micrarchaeota archaeon]